MARKKRASDEAYNARRRFKRQAERLEREGKRVGGSYGDRLREVAKELRGNAANLYAKKGREYRSDLIRQSENVRAMSEERQTDILLSSNVGSRIYAGTVEIWQDADVNEREDAIIRAFGVYSMLDVLKILEKMFGESLYADAPNGKIDSPNDTAVLRIQQLFA